MTKDIVMVLVLAFPMLLFSVYPGLKLSDYLEKKYNIEESAKRKVMIITTIIFTLSLSSSLYYI